MFSALLAALTLATGAAGAPPGSLVPSPAKSWEEECGALFRMSGPVPKEYAECVAQAGPEATRTISFSLGDSREQLSRSLPEPIENLIWVSGEPLSLRWNAGDAPVVFENVGGMSQTVVTVSLGADDRIGSVAFPWQNRPLRLEEGLSKAKALRARLQVQGFRDVEPAFQVTSDGGFAKGAPAGDWAQAGMLLQDDARNVVEMRLFRMSDGKADVQMALENRRRGARAFAKSIPDPLPNFNRSYYEDSGGHEWVLNVRLSRSE